MFQSLSIPVFFARFFSRSLASFKSPSAAQRELSLQLSRQDPERVLIIQEHASHLRKHAAKNKPFLGSHLTNQSGPNISTDIDIEVLADFGLSPHPKFFYFSHFCNFGPYVFHSQGLTSNYCIPLVQKRQAGNGVHHHSVLVLFFSHFRLKMVRLTYGTSVSP